ncbi:carbamoyltransferase [Ascidiimonas sp. W6]|uniref:carbamoyltransferase family protein n=1 Tax=Ascidiimonas meishanensis TaxID=3128903 RepID=UPI0030EF66C4
MNIIGINGGPNHLNTVMLESILPGQLTDSSVALLKDGDVIFALEEERTTRIKHTNYFPKTAIEQCLIYNNLDYKDIDYVAFATSKETLESFAPAFIKGPLPANVALVIAKNIFKEHTGYELELSQIKLYDHHYCHALSTFCKSGFDKSLVVTLDGSGNGLSGTVYVGEGNELERLKHFPIEKSLGFLYLEVTKFLGMKLFDEYKIMGLAPYGDSTVYSKLFESFYTLLPDGEFAVHFNKLSLLQTICPKRNKKDPITKEHKDIAAALQAALERIVFHIIAPLQQQTKLKKLCMAGGVALNCKMGGELLHAGLFEEIFVFPAAGDNGLSSGAAFACYLETGNEFVNSKIASTSLGKHFNSKEIERELQKWNGFVDLSKSDQIYEDAADLLASGEVLGWFRGREEYGPRALGNRSIVADPRPADNKERINAIIKMREGFRPFAPAILEEHFEEYFETPANGQKEFPFMTFILKAQEKYRNVLNAVVHVDGSARVQTVPKNANKDFWNLINAFYERTGTPVLLNTSLNNNFEPIVHSPENIMGFLLTSNVNYVIIEDYIVHKKVLNGDHAIYARPELCAHISLSTREAVANKHFLYNTYLSEETEISEKLWNVLNEQLVVNFSQSTPLLDEIIDIWRQRLIKVQPQKVLAHKTEKLLKL